MNFDPRSFTENTEIGIVFESEAFARDMATWFDNEIDSTAYKVSLEPNGNGRDKLVWKSDESEVKMKEPDTTWFERTVASIMSWLPGESQL